MTHHNKEFLRQEELNKSLKDHGLEVEKPSQLSDAFRLGWQAALKLEKICIDSTPYLYFQDSSFEDWFFHYEQGRNPHKEVARAAYAAGMGDPLVMPNPKENLWTNTTVPMNDDKPEDVPELESGDIVKWGSGPEEYEAIRASGFNRLWIFKSLDGKPSLFRARLEDVQIIKKHS